VSSWAKYFAWNAVIICQVTPSQKIYLPTLKMFVSYRNKLA